MINTFRATLPPQGYEPRTYYDIRNENFDTDIKLQSGKLYQQVPYSVTNTKININNENSYDHKQTIKRKKKKRQRQKHLKKNLHIFKKTKNV